MTTFRSRRGAPSRIPAYRFTNSPKLRERVFSVMDDRPALYDTPTTTPPGQVVNVQASAGDGLVTITFDLPVDGGPPTRFIVTVTPGDTVVTTTETTLVFTGLDNGTEVTFDIVAENDAGMSDPVTTPAVTPRLSISGWTWRSGAASSPIADRSVTWSAEKSLFVAVGSNTVATSVDGLDTWTARTPANANNWNDICYAPELDLFCACASVMGFGHAAMTSSDGAVWTQRVTYNVTPLAALAWNGAKFVACQMSGRYGDWSADGVTWGQVDFGRAVTWRGIAWGPVHGWVAAGGAALSTSGDGTTWISRDANIPAGMQSITGKVRYLNGEYWAVGENGTANPCMMRATDPTVPWTGVSLPESEAAMNVHDIAYGGGLYVASGYRGTNDNAVWLSQDGTTWTAWSGYDLNPTNNNYSGVAYADSLERFVLTSSTGIFNGGLTHYFLSSQ